MAADCCNTHRYGLDSKRRANSKSGLQCISSHTVRAGGNPSCWDGALVVALEQPSFALEEAELRERGFRDIRQSSCQEDFEWPAVEIHRNPSSRKPSEFTSARTTTYQYLLGPQKLPQDGMFTLERCCPKAAGSPVGFIRYPTAFQQLVDSFGLRLLLRGMLSCQLFFRT